MELQELNKLFKNLNDLRVGKNLVESQSNVFVQCEGASDTKYEVYKLDKSDLYIKLRIETDSYGDNEYVAGIQFVKPTEKIIQTFETI